MPGTRASDNRSSEYRRSYRSDRSRSSRRNDDSYYKNKKDYRNEDDENASNQRHRNDDYKRNNENNEKYSNHKREVRNSSRPLSPLKRRNYNDTGNTDNNLESPQKRLKENMEVKHIGRFNLSSFSSPKKSRSSSLCSARKENHKKYFSTPKSERRAHTVRVKKMIEENSIAMERNLSSNWADILEELEEQTKEIETYVSKCSEKYGIDKEALRKNIVIDAEILRKRQKQINYGKVTGEYQRYVLEVPRKKRQAYHPKTPNKFRKCSRRKFDGLVKKWRKLLHAYDEDPEQLEDMRNSIDTNEMSDNTDDFGGASNVGSGISGYNIDDFDIIDSDEERLVVNTPMDEI